MDGFVCCNTFVCVSVCMRKRVRVRVCGCVCGCMCEFCVCMRNRVKDRESFVCVLSVCFCFRALLHLFESKQSFHVRMTPDMEQGRKSLALGEGVINGSLLYLHLRLSSSSPMGLITP